MQSSRSKPDQPAMTSMRRWSGLYTIGLILLVLIFFAIHQWRHTAFLTYRFGPAERIALYLPIVFSMAAPLMRTIQGKTNPARFLEAISDILLAAGSTWLLVTFPFSFAHFADIFPANLQPAFGWITDSVGRVILGLQIAIAAISVLTTLVTYGREKRGKSTG